MTASASNIVQMPAPVKPKRRIRRFRLTEAAVRDLPLQGQDPDFGPDEKYPAIYYDEELRGFFVLCHRSSKTFYVQHDIAGKSVIAKVARTTELTPTDARKKAAKSILGMRDGVNPNQQKKQRELATLAKADTEAFMLNEAVALYLDESKRRRARSPKTDNEYRRIFNTLLKPYLDKPLVWLGQNQQVIETLHDDITRNGFDSETKKGRGRKKRKPAPYSANGMFRAYRAVFNFARKKRKHLNLPELDAIELNPESPKDCSMTLEQLPAWYVQVQKMHPIHRDFNLFALFTGNRSTAARQTRWEDVDLTGL